MPLAKFAMEHSGWEVMWVKRKKGKNHIVCIDFEDDLVGAMELFEKAKRGKKPLATLRCKNVGFPPPERYIDRMRAYNHKGVWWCPYCMQLRRFEKRNWMEVEGLIGKYDEGAYFCPMCDISHRDHNVIKYNPIAKRLRDGNTRKRSSRGRKKRARR